MKYLKQLLTILAFCLLGEVLASVIPLPIPAAIYGLILLLIALSTGLLKAHAISDTANFLIQIMPILFVAPAANILQHWGLIAPSLIPIVLIAVLIVLGLWKAEKAMIKGFGIFGKGRGRMRRHSCRCQDCLR